MHFLGYHIGHIAMTLALVTGAFFASRLFSLYSLRSRIVELERNIADHRRAATDLYDRATRAEKTIESLQKSIVMLPDIAQRLSACRHLQDIPARALDLVHELFEPSYGIFYVTRRGELVAAATQGECDFPVGHRVKFGEGIVGWTGLKQLPMTPDDIRYESSQVRQKNLSTNVPRGGFSLCLPVIYDSWTLGVILMGPTEREVPRQREVGLTVTMLTSVTMMSALTLKQQRNLAKTDGLTGLLNKTHLLRRIDETMDAEGETPRPMSVFLFDIDHFKHYNDTQGHQQGNVALGRVAEILRTTGRRGDIVARYGGEEFVALLYGASREEAWRFAESVRLAIEASEFAGGEKQPLGRVTISGGVASFPLEAAGRDALVERADRNLYLAKQSGRNRIVASPA